MNTDVLKHNSIIHGDSNQVLHAMRDACIDLVVTDPPYLVNYRDRDGRTIKNDDAPDSVLGVFDELYRVLKRNSYCVSFYGWSAIAEFSAAWKNAGFRIVGRTIWPKRYASGHGYMKRCHEAAMVLAKGLPKRPLEPIRDVQEWAYSGNKIHPTQKAVSVIEPLIQAFSQPGDLVLDPFSGSGTTALAAALNGRRYMGIELEHEYCEISRRRLSEIERSRVQA